MIQIIGKTFTCGILLDNKEEKVELTAPIVKYMRGWTLEEVADYCELRKWQASRKDEKTGTWRPLRDTLNLDTQRGNNGDNRLQDSSSTPVAGG